MIGRCEKNDGVNFVDFDFESAMTVAVDHLVDLGHQNIAFDSVLTDPKRNHYGPSVRALHGYEKACASYKIPKLYCETENGFENVRRRTPDSFFYCHAFKFLVKILIDSEFLFFFCNALVIK